MDKELLDILQGKDEVTEPKKEFKEITLKFGKGCVGDEFQGKADICCKGKSGT